MSAITRGIVLGQDGDELIIQATDAEVARFGKGSAVAVAQAAKGKARHGEFTVEHFEWATNGILYDSAGRPVCMVKNFQVEQVVDQIEVMTFAQPEFRYHIEAEGPV